MARDDKKKWRCTECDVISFETDLLSASNPFDAAYNITGCPVCKEIGCFEEVCDEPGCTAAATCGFPTGDDGDEFGGYRRTCIDHFARQSLKLTEFEKEMHQKLYKRGKILWSHTTHQETKALNRLMKMGYATYNGEHRCWEPAGA